MINPQLERKLKAILGKHRVSTGFAETLVYQSDGLTLHKAQPGCVVFPESTAEVQSVVKACIAADTPYVARGAGTGLSGGAVMDGGVIVELSRMNRIIAIQPEDRYAIVQPGVVNNHLSIAAKPYGMEFAPDPSSQMVCTIGGNVAENAGGPHTLKYGVTTNHVLGQTAVLGDGEIVTAGGPWPVQRGSSFSSFLVGTEGTVAITTEIIVRLMPTEPGVKTMLAVFDSVAAATDSVTAILSAGVLTSAMEFMDKQIIKAIEAHLKAGYPTDAAAVLLIEIDGEDDRLDDEAIIIAQVCKDVGLKSFHIATDDAQRQRLWLGRKHALGAIGKLTPAFYTNDGVVPRSRLTDILLAVGEISRSHKLSVANLAHAGDGNIHPNILFDPRSTGDKERAMACSEEILHACLEMGGSLTGEHGIGLEKRDLMATMFSDADRYHMLRLKDALNPSGLMNPAKIFPVQAGCSELRKPPEGTWI